MDLSAGGRLCCFSRSLPSLGRCHADLRVAPCTGHYSFSAFPARQETHSPCDLLPPHTSRTARSPGASCSSGHLHSSGCLFICLLVPLYLPGLNVEHARTLSTCVPCSGGLKWLWVSCRCGLPSLHPTGTSRLNSRHTDPLAGATCSLG